MSKNKTPDFKTNVNRLNSLKHQISPRPIPKFKEIKPH